MTSKRRSFILLIFLIKVQKISPINSYFLQAKAMLNSFRIFGELVFFDLWILDSGFWISCFRFRISDFGSGIPIPFSWFSGCPCYVVSLTAELS